MLPPDRHHILLQRINLALLMGFLAVALTLIFWSILRTPVTLSREDNPRLVEAELRIQRGQITDRNNLILAQTVGPSDRLDRIYPLPAAGPAVGYYSFRHGTAGVEAGLDGILRGDNDSFWSRFFRQSLHQPQVGQSVQLTLDANWQETAETLLPAQPSALLLLQLDGALADIVALVSHPGYDPNQLDETFESLMVDENAPLLNRVTQGQYQPGLLLQPFLIAAALEQNRLNLSTTLATINEPVSINGGFTQCHTQPPTPATWLHVLQHRCPAPMQTLADQWGESGLDQIFADFAFTRVPSLPLPLDPPTVEPITNPLLAGIGQEELTLSPLQVGLAWAALGGDGHIPTPRLVLTLQDTSGITYPYSVTISAEQTAVSSQTTALIRQSLPQHNNILEYSLLVLSGPANNTHAWYLALTPADSPRYALILVLENSTDISLAEKIGRGLLTAVDTS